MSAHAIEKNPYSRPDFAYPAKVSANALATLDRALASGDHSLAVRALLNYAIAESEVDRSSLSAVISRADSMLRVTSDPSVKAMVNIVLGQIYQSVYSSDRWVYDRRQLPLEPRPADYNEWSGEQFKAVVIEHVDSALSYAPHLGRVPLADYKQLLTPTDFRCYPTLYDFIAQRAIDLLESLSRHDYVFSINWICRDDVYVRLPFNYQSPIARRILSVYADLLEFHHDGGLPFVMVDIERLDFVSNGVYNDGYTSYDEKLIRHYNVLSQLYDRYRNDEAGWLVLNAMSYVCVGLENEKSLYGSINDYLHRMGPNKRLSYILSTLSTPLVNAEYQSTVVPGSDLEIKVVNNNASAYKLHVFKVSYPHSRNTSSYYTLHKGRALPALVATVNGSCTANVPFVDTVVHKVRIAHPGAYIVVPVIANEAANSRTDSYPIVHCTNLLIQPAAYAGDRWATVVNPLSGAAVPDVRLTVIDGKVVSSSTTDLEGVAKLKPDNGRIFATKGVDRYAASAYVANTWDGDDRTSVSLQSFVDLALYHPGDTVQWAAVVNTNNMKTARLLTGCEIRVTFRDANRQMIDSTHVVTDDFGRIDGAFAIPSDGLTGNYSLEFERRDPSGNDRWLSESYQGVMVSDYKLPTYHIEFTDVLRDSPSRGDVTVKGQVLSYSGFPMADTRLAVNLKVMPRRFGWWFGGNATSFYTTESVTDADGSFVIEFPARLLESSPVPGGLFDVVLTATSSTGENREASRTFNVGKPYDLSVTLPADVDVSSPVKLNLTLSQLVGGPVAAPVDYSVVDAGGAVVARGSVESTKPVVDFMSVPSGVYSLNFVTADTSLAEPVTIADVHFYRPDDSMPPVASTPLWVPVTSYTVDSRRISLLYGTTSHEGHVRYIVRSSDKIISQGWLDVPAGMHRFDYELPRDIDKVTVTLAAVSDYRSEVKDIKVVTRSSLRDITLSIGSFRDNLIPGSTETWTLTVTDRDGNPARAAVMMDMYCKALDDLNPFSFRYYPWRAGSLSLRFDAGNGLGSSNSTVSHHVRNVVADIAKAPDFEMWGMSFISGRNLYVRGLSGMRSYKSMNVVREHKQEIEVEEEAADAVTMVTNEMKMAPAAALSENAVFASADTGGAENDEAAPDSRVSVEYRPAEVALAFFAPRLSTGPDGSVQYTFTVPNANTTWQLYAFAYTDDLLTSSLDRTAVSSKPVMVQPNLPRFMRTGDKAIVKASVMNNSDTLRDVLTTVEVFDPVTGTVFNRTSQSDSIAAKSSATVSITVEAPVSAIMLGYRIVSTSDGFSDGQQDLLPVLPSSTPVVDTTPFYLPAETGDFEVKLPKMPDDARVTLQFCENPAWYVATALPGLRNDDSDDALSATAAIFSAAVAEGLLKSQPTIASALKDWSESDHSDSTLVSMLERNSDLKTVLLNSTPWVMDAQSDTERMQRLAMLFDRKNISSVYSAAMKRLQKLSCDDGGLAWMPQYHEASQFVTMNFVAAMGHLNRLGYLPSINGLDRMIDGALSYIDRETAKDYDKYPKGDYMTYTLVRGYFPARKQSTAAARVSRATVQKLVSGWKNLDVIDKACAALILNGNGYPSVAREVVASLREFARTTSDMGMWWPSLDDMTAWSMGKISATAMILDAFVAVDPASADVDRIRQWLILQKEAKNWGTSVSTTAAVASILGSGTSWTARQSAAAVVKIGGKPVEVSHVDSRLGYFRTSVSDMKPSGKILTIDKPAMAPAWGAVYCQYVDAMVDVKPESCADLSIEKTMYRRVDSADGVKWVESSDFTTGDVVQVNLTLHVGRDIDYVAIIDSRAACLEPVEQLPQPIFSEGIYFYRENRDSATNIFVSHLPKGTYRLSYEMYVNNAGEFASGIASAQSQYAPALSAHSGGSLMIVKQQ